MDMYNGKRFANRRLENNIRWPSVHISQINHLNMLLTTVFDACTFIYYFTSPLPVSKKDIYCIDNLDADALKAFNADKGWETDPALYIHHNEEYTLWQANSRFSNRYLIQSKHEGTYQNGITVKMRRNDGGSEILSVATDKILSRNFVNDNYPQIFNILRSCNCAIFKIGISSIKKSKIINELSSREVEVIKLAADGYTSEESAAVLFVTKSTINFHLKKIISKLNCTNKTQAVAKAVMFNLI